MLDCCPVKFEIWDPFRPILSGENREISVFTSGAERVILIGPPHLYSGVLPASPKFYGG